MKHGRYYEFINNSGEKRVVALHNNDPNRAVHAHALIVLVEIYLLFPLAVDTENHALMHI